MTPADIKRRFERRTGLIFGVHRHESMPVGTSLGTPVFYLRLGSGRDGLVRFEVGTSRGFVYLTRNEDPS